MLLFAYGTLKDPRQRAAVLGAAPRCRVVGNGESGGILYDAGEYPALVASDSAADTVPGVVLEIDETALRRLDDYEGVHDGLYTRRRRAVRLDGGGTAEAWVYLYARSIAGLRRIAAWPPDHG